MATGQLKDALANFHQLRSATTSVSSPILASDGSLLSDRENKLKRWEEHFSQLLNRHPAPPSEELQQGAAVAAEDPWDKTKIQTTVDLPPV